MPRRRQRACASRGRRSADRPVPADRRELAQAQRHERQQLGRIAEIDVGRQQRRRRANRRRRPAAPTPSLAAIAVRSSAHRPRRASQPRPYQPKLASVKISTSHDSHRSRASPPRSRKRGQAQQHAAAAPSTASASRCALRPAAARTSGGSSGNIRPPIFGQKYSASRQGPTLKS